MKLTSHAPVRSLLFTALASSSSSFSNRCMVAVYGVNLTDELSFANDLAVSALADGVRRSGRPINPRTYGLEVALFF